MKDGDLVVYPLDALSLYILIISPSTWSFTLDFELLHRGGLRGVVKLTLPMARAERGTRPVYYLPCSDLEQVANLSLSVA